MDCLTKVFCLKRKDTFEVEATVDVKTSDDHSSPSTVDVKKIDDPSSSSQEKKVKKEKKKDKAENKELAGSPELNSATINSIEDENAVNTIHPIEDENIGHDSAARSYSVTDSRKLSTVPSEKSARKDSAVGSLTDYQNQSEVPSVIGISEHESVIETTHESVIETTHESVTEITHESVIETTHHESVIETTHESVIETTHESNDLTESLKPSVAQIGKAAEDITKRLVLSDETLEEVCRSLDEEIHKGLGKETNKKATIKCFPTFVQELPNGKERGRFLALDLGGTNFRVLLIELGEVFHMDSKIYAVPQDIMIGPGTGLFDHIANCLASFISERDMQAELLPLGFTFSFPCAQEGLTKARLAQWTKGFTCAGVEGEDVVELLQQAIARRKDVSIKICAVLNDTTGTLMSCAWKNRNCMIGLIVGTGTNACYMENIENVELWNKEDSDHHSNQFTKVVINTEWGAFGDNGCLENVREQCDRNIDRESINPGRQLYEKMISGMYMGEIARQVLVQLIDEGLLFADQPTDAIREKGMFFTKYISEIESDPRGSITNCISVLEDLGICEPSDEDCFMVRHVCETVSRRAATLAGAGVSVLLNRIKEDHVTVAVDGSVFRFHPFFKDIMVETITKLVSPETKFDLMLSEDGSGRGAALVAAVAVRSAAERAAR